MSDKTTKEERMEQFRINSGMNARRPSYNRKNKKRGEVIPRDIKLKEMGKCQRCEILLSSKFAGSDDGNYCEDCLNELNIQEKI